VNRLALRQPTLLMSTGERMEDAGAIVALHGALEERQDRIDKLECTLGRKTEEHEIMRQQLTLMQQQLIELRAAATARAVGGTCKTLKAGQSSEPPLGTHHVQPMETLDTEQSIVAPPAPPHETSAPKMNGAAALTEAVLRHPIRMFDEAVRRVSSLSTKG
jgi:hypothetical protein